MQRFFPLIMLPLILSGCPQKEPPPASRAVPREAVAMPTVNEAFVRAALHPEARLATKPLLVDLDPKPGTEAVVVIHRGNTNHEIAVLRGNHKVLARDSLGGKMLRRASLRHVGAIKIEKLLPDGGKVLLLPVETSIKKQWVCGALIFRYRDEMLVMAGELHCNCWRKAAGATADVDPYASLISITHKDGKALIRMQEQKGVRVYGWDAEQAAFVPRALE